MRNKDIWKIKTNFTHDPISVIGKKGKTIVEIPIKTMKETMHIIRKMVEAHNESLKVKKAKPNYCKHPECNVIVNLNKTCIVHIGWWTEQLKRN